MPFVPDPQLEESSRKVVPDYQPREGHGAWDAMVAGVQGTGSAMMLRGKLPDVVLDPHNSSWYEKLLSSGAAIVADAVPEIAGALGGTAVAGPIGGGAGAMAMPTEIRESLMKAYKNGDADSSSSFLSRAGIVINGLTDKDVLAATAKAGAIGGLTMGAGKFAAPLGKAATLGAEVGTLAVAPAALDGRLPEMQDFADAAVLLVGMKGAIHVASKTLPLIYSKTGVRPEQVALDAQTDPTIKEDLLRGRESLEDFSERSGEEIGGVSHLRGIVSKLQKIYVERGPEVGRAMLDDMAENAPDSSGFSKEVATKGFLDELDSELSTRAKQFNLQRSWTGAPTMEELLKEAQQKDLGSTPEQSAAAMERVREAQARVHKEILADPERLATYAKEVGMTPEDYAARLAGYDVPRAYRPQAASENAKAAVPGEKAQEFVAQPFADVPQAEGEPAKPTHINYNYINTQPEVEGALSRLSKLYVDDIQQQRRGTVSNQQTYSEAGNILNRWIGGEDKDVQRMNTLTDVDHELGARILAKKQLAVGAAENVMQMRDEYVKNPTDVNKLQYMAAIERSATILGNFLGERAEIGRAMEILKNTKNDAERAKQLATLIEVFKKDPDKLAIAMGMMDDPGAILKASKAAVTATLWDKVIEYFKASIVSGPWTHAANLSGNTAFMAMRPVIEQVASVLGTLRGGEERTLMIQPLSRVIGNINGAFEVAKLASKVYQLEGATGVIKAAWASGNRSAKAEVSQGGAIGGTWGKVVRSSFQVLGAEDSLFKTLNERGELYSMASRMATKEGLSPMTLEFWKRVGDLVSNPTEGDLSSAKDAGLRLTFNQPLGEKGKAAQAFIRAWHLEWAAPFTQTPGNIAKEMIRMTPFAPFVGEWRAAISEGGAARDKAIAELAIGSAMMTATFALARAGIITGSATGTPGEKNMKEAAGVQPTSVLVNGKYYDISRIQPVGTLIVLAADLANGWDKLEAGEHDKAAKVGAVAFASAITNQTMLQGLTMFVNALSEPDRFFPRMAQSYAGAMVPFSGLMRQSAEFIDKEQRRIDSIKDAVYAAIPILREQLLPKVNVLTGEPMETKERAIGQKTTTESQDKVLTEAVRLGVGVSKAPKNIQVPSPDKKLGQIELTPEQQNMFTTAAGKMAHNMLSQIVTSPSWPRLDDLQKKKVFARVFTAARKFGAITAVPGDARIEKAQEIADQIEESMK